MHCKIHFPLQFTLMLCILIANYLLFEMALFWCVSCDLLIFLNKSHDPVSWRWLACCVNVRFCLVLTQIEITCSEKISIDYNPKIKRCHLFLRWWLSSVKVAKNTLKRLLQYKFSLSDKIHLASNVYCRQQLPGSWFLASWFTSTAVKRLRNTVLYFN